MTDSRFSWEILACGILLTITSVYFVHSSGKPERSVPQEVTVQVIESHSSPKVVASVKIPENKTTTEAKTIILQSVEKLSQKKKEKTPEEIAQTFEQLVVELQKQAVFSEDILKVITTEVEKATSALADIEDLDLSIVTSGTNISVVHSGATGSNTNSGDGYVYKEEVFRDAAIKQVHLKTLGGNIAVTGGNGNELRIKIVASGKDITPERIEELYHVELKRKGAEVHAEISRKDRGILQRNWRSNFGMNIVVEAPTDMHVNARTSGGNIQASHISGNQSMQTSGGNISLEAMDGSGEFRTSGGNIRATEVIGGFGLQTSGGNITLDQCSGDFKARTSGGALSIDWLSGSLDASTSGGSVKALVHDLNQDVSLSTSGGNIEFKMSPNTAASLDARASRVNLDKAFHVDGQIRENNVNGTINGTGPLVKLRTSAGVISVRTP